MTDLEKFKQTHKPKEGYSFILGVDPYSTEGKLTASVFKKTPITNRNRSTGETEEYVMECSVLNVRNKYTEFIKALEPYIEKI